MTLGRFFFFACVAGGLVARAPLASADVLYDNVRPDASNTVGESSVTGDTLAQSFSYTGGFTITGLDLVLDSADSPRTGSFTLLVVGTAAGNLPDLASTPAITVGTFSDTVAADTDSGPPATHFAVNNVVLSPSDGEYWVVLEDAALATPALPPSGTDWWFEGTPPSGTGTAGQWGYDALNAPGNINPFSTDTYGPNIMTVSGIAPVAEPETLAVLAAGLAGLGIARLRRRRAAV